VPRLVRGVVVLVLHYGPRGPAGRLAPVRHRLACPRIAVIRQGEPLGEAGIRPPRGGPPAASHRYARETGHRPCRGRPPEGGSGPPPHPTAEASPWAPLNSSHLCRSRRRGTSRSASCCSSLCPTSSPRSSDSPPERPRRRARASRSPCAAL